MTVPHQPGESTPSSDHARLPLPPPLIYVLGWLAGWLLQHRWAVTLSRSPVWVVAGIGSLALGFFLGAWALAAFRSVRASPNPWIPTQALALRGPYRFSRNPMYLGLSALYTGAAILTRMGWPLLLLPAVLVTVQRLIIIREEAYLERKFGQAYRDYAGRVRRWL